jgi:tetratricopeptide (TPR) repeat protein
MEDLNLAILRARNSHSRRADCPPDARWAEVAAGVAAREAEQALLAHAAECDRCSLLVAAAAEAMDVPETEPPTLHAAPASSMRARIPARSWLARAAAAFVVLLPALWWMWPRWQVYQAGHELAVLYARNRGTEFRLSGMPHGRSEGARSSGRADGVPLPAAARGTPLEWRNAIVERDYASAVALLEKANAERPSNDTASDLAAAIGARGDLTGSAADFERALGLVEGVLQANPLHAPAAFNRLLLLIRLKRFEEARQAARELAGRPDEAPWQRDVRDLQRSIP